MSFIPWCAVGGVPWVGDSGKETIVLHSWKKESGRKSSWKIVSLRVPGTADYKKSSSAPDVIRVCQEPHAQKKPRKKFNHVGFVIVPELSKFGERRQQSFEMSTSSSVPSIKRCSLDEIEAVKYALERAVSNVNSKNATEKVRGRTQRSGELYKTPARHPSARRTRARHYDTRFSFRFQ